MKLYLDTYPQVKVPNTLRGKGVEKTGKSVWIRATHEVEVYCVNKEAYSTDAYLALPVGQLTD